MLSGTCLGIRGEPRPQGRPLVVDAELPGLASKAAVELHCIMRGSPCGNHAITRLAALLENGSFTTAEEPQQTRPHRFMDPTATLVVADAMKQTFVDPPTDVDGVLQKAAEVSKALRNPPNEKEELSQLQRFCISLSRLASSQLDAIGESTPTHPYRR
jgi:hypothetical protein